MKSRFARFVIPLVIGFAAIGILFAVMNGKRAGEATGVVAKVSAPVVVEPRPTEDVPVKEVAASIDPVPSVIDSPMSARAPSGAIASPAPIGSLDPSIAPFQVQFEPFAASISHITFSEYWNTAEESRQAALSAKDSSISAPADAQRFTLRPEGALYWLDALGATQSQKVPMLAFRSIEIDTIDVDLFGPVWSEQSPGLFVTEVITADGSPIVRVTRKYSISTSRFDLTIDQRVENLSKSTHTVRLWCYGPGDLALEAGGLLDVRRVQFGYLLPPERDPSQSTVIAHDATLERAAVISLLEDNTAGTHLWPSEQHPSEAMSWFGTTNRYFALAVHAPYSADGTAAGSSKSLMSSIEAVTAQMGRLPDGEPAVFTLMSSPPRTIVAEGSTSFDLGLYAGPLARKVLIEQEPYSALNMVGLILYQMSGCCTWCTFGWLANGLVIFLELIHDYAVFDWGLAIIVLVILVRFALYPLSKRSQIQMQKVSRTMGALKPELEELQKRHKGDPKRMQQEQMRLYSEYGVNPLGCIGGFLPMLLQMPIWIALYAVLYLAFELRQQPAFFGIFQQLNGWSFLGDLSAPDSFFAFGRSYNFWAFTLEGINVIPLVMGLVFFIQQKYMQPPMAANMSPEQIQQQKMMKWMMVILFPVMLYKAPSGLTLYIMTSTIIGIFESKRVRDIVSAMDLTPKKRKPVIPQDETGRRYTEAIERAQDRSNKKSFKDRE
ncbi:MAG: membrane protein insertase YidC [Planctomycetota bacterium]|nr:membrane protein insertase YidC [Planctomycetota bacterium]